MKRTLPLLLAVLCLITSVPSQAQLGPAYSARLQTVLDSMCNRYHVKGASAAVYVPGMGTWKGVHGDSYAGQPITSSMAFPLNSNSKTYVAALMLKLQEQGALQLSDTIGKWIHNKPNISGQITIRQMLNHTSGLYSYTDSAAFADSINADFTRIWQPDEMLKFVGKPLFAPGTGWSYSNTNFLLAGMIISQVTGMPVEQAIRTRLLASQGLNDTWFYPQETPTATIPHFWFGDGQGGNMDGTIAFGYTPEGFYSAASTAGALFSTAEDNVTFWRKLTSGQIINAASLGEWRQTVPLSSKIGYGLGMFRYKSFNGRVVYEHGGTGAGAINENLADSASGVSISLLTNQDSADNDILFNQIVRVLHLVTINPPTAVATIASAASFTLYPNPAQAQLQIRWSRTPATACSYVITDAAGRAVQHGFVSQQPDAAIPVSGLENGLYFLQLNADGGAAVSRSFTVLR